VEYRKMAVNIQEERADVRTYGRKADKFAIYSLANIVSLTGSSLVGAGAMEYIYKCIGLEYEPCMKYTFP